MSGVAAGVTGTKATANTSRRTKARAKAKAEAKSQWSHLFDPTTGRLPPGVRPPWLKKEFDFSGTNQPDPVRKNWKELDLRRNIRSFAPQAVTNIIGMAMGFDPLGRVCKTEVVQRANEWLVENGFGKVGERLAILVASLDSDNATTDPLDPNYNPENVRVEATPEQKMKFLRDLIRSAMEVKGLPKTSHLLEGVTGGGTNGDAPEEAEVITPQQNGTGNGNSNGSGGH